MAVSRDIAGDMLPTVVFCALLIAGAGSLFTRKQKRIGIGACSGGRVSGVLVTLLVLSAVVAAASEALMHSQFHVADYVRAVAAMTTFAGGAAGVAIAIQLRPSAPHKTKRP